MEKESTTSRPKGMCEKIFDAFNPASRPHRRLLDHQEHETTTNPSPTRPNHSLDSGMKEPSPQKAPTAPVKPRPPTPPPPPPPKVPEKAVAAPAPPKAVTIRKPAPPHAGGERSKKNINEKVEDYIKRARERIRAVSGVGRSPTPK